MLASQNLEFSTISRSKIFEQILRSNPPPPQPYKYPVTTSKLRTCFKGLGITIFLQNTFICHLCPVGLFVLAKKNQAARPGESLPMVVSLRESLIQRETTCYRHIFTYGSRSHTYHLLVTSIICSTIISTN